MSFIKNRGVNKNGKEDIIAAPDAALLPPSL